MRDDRPGSADGITERDDPRGAARDDRDSAARDDRGGGSRPHGAQDGLAADAEALRPERPSLEGQAPAPLSGAIAIPDGVKGALMTWHISMGLTAFAIVTMILTRGGLVTHLKEALIERDPSVAGKTLETAAPRIVFAAIGALALIVVIELILVRVFAARHSWPRFALVLLVVLHVVVALLASLLVPETAWQAWVLTLALLLGALAALVATVRSFFPKVSAWTHRHESDAVLS